MQIEKIEIFRIEKPIRAPYTTAFGTAVAFNSIMVTPDLKIMEQVIQEKWATSV